MGLRHTEFAFRIFDYVASGEGLSIGFCQRVSWRQERFFGRPADICGASYWYDTSKSHIFHFFNHLSNYSSAGKNRRDLLSIEFYVLRSPHLLLGVTLNPLECFIYLLLGASQRISGSPRTAIGISSIGVVPGNLVKCRRKRLLVILAPIRALFHRIAELSTESVGGSDYVSLSERLHD